MRTILLAFLLTACGPAYHTPEVEEIVGEFETIYATSAAGVTILISNTIPPAPLPPGGGVQVGVCEFGSRTVTLLKAKWDISTHETQKALLFHELGHCVFNRAHKSDLYDDNCPKSIMNPYVVSDICFQRHAEDLLNELPGQ